MISRGARLCITVCACVAGQSLRAQSGLTVVVVQVAGSNLYLNAGADAGVVAGDTVAVRRRASGDPVGAVAVVAATGTRSVVAFAGAPFPVTRGDTLFITPGRHAVEGARIARTSAIDPLASTLRPPKQSGPRGIRIDGALGLELWSSGTTTIGLGASPLRTSRTVSMPAVRFHARAEGQRSNVSLSARAQQRFGPTAMFDRGSNVRIYEARVEHSAGAFNLALGRFYSDFDHASGFWDGASIRVGDRGGLFGGVAAGFDPVRHNEGFSANVPKYAAFVGTQSDFGATRLASDLSFHQTLPRDTSTARSVVDWSTRLNAGHMSVAQELEMSPAEEGGAWSIARYNARVSAPMSSAVDLYGSVLSDRPLPLDSAWTVGRERRELVSAGLSYRAGNWLFVDMNGSVNAPRDSSRGYAVGGMLALPDVIRRATLTLSGNYFSSPDVRGITAISSIDYPVMTAQMRLAFQFFRSAGTGYSLNTFGADARVSQSLSSRVSWVAQLNARYGANLRSTTGFSTFEVRF